MVLYLSRVDMKTLNNIGSIHSTMLRAISKADFDI